ncbi:D-alanyl-D-alanine carboxypeptidase [Paracoccaceae bacterium]|nr:D-alanyl-D-alanine carboxypeptidase [Paracoccaceae bacterium]
MLSKRKFITFSALTAFTALFPLQALAEVTNNFFSLIKKSGFEKNTSFMAIDLRSNMIIGRHNEKLRLPIASVTKMVTASYYLNNKYTPDQFKTELFLDGVIEGRNLRGDLYLKGHGDPTLKTDDLSLFIDAIENLGISKVEGSLFYDNSYLPDVNYINRNQLPQYAYNPGMGAINLNENRILFKWKRVEKGKYEISLTAPGLKNSAKVTNITVDLENNKGPVYNYKIDENEFKESWSVNKRILSRKGSRWLPVRESSYYTTEVLRQLLINRGIEIRHVKRGIVPKKSKLLCTHYSDKNTIILKNALKYSKNMVTESMGLAASRTLSSNLYDLDQSAVLMTRWFRRITGKQNSLFLNHSGLSAGSFSTSEDFRRFLMLEKVQKSLLPVLKLTPIYTSKGKVSSIGNITVRAKSGTMHYIRGLAGYICKEDKPVLAFSIFSADLKKRKDNSSNNFESPRGSSAWLSRAVIQERQLIRKLIGQV